MSLHLVSVHGTVRRMAALQERQLVDRWRGILTTYNAIANALDRALQHEHDIGLSEFEALDRLIETGDKCILKALGSDMYLSQSALSRTFDRLERQEGEDPDVFAGALDVVRRDLLAHRDGRVPPGEYSRMRAPFQEGDFPAPVKYGYASVGVVECGPERLVGRPVFALYPHQTRYVVPAAAAHVLPDGKAASLSKTSRFGPAKDGTSFA